MKNEILLGNYNLNNENKTITGEFVDFDGESFYKIANYDKMDPFFMTIVSNSDHWMFISSNGGLSAGRKNPDLALFPYYTVDKIQDSAEISGSKTILLVTRGSKTSLWEVFSDKYNGVYKIQRNIYKNVYGNKILFEEINEDLGITFSYQWMNSEKFGFIKKSMLINNLESPCSVSVLDGIQNILPAEINQQLQNSLSNLVDAYKKSELVTNTNIGLYMLSSVIVDKAEPSEALSSTVVWSEGLSDAKILLSSSQLKNFRKGLPIEEEKDIRATRGAYFINAEIELSFNEKREWHIVADINKNSGYIATLKHFLSDNKNCAQQLLDDVNDCTKDLVRILASADGLQLTGDKLGVNRHLSNVLFNVMRGGIFDDNYSIGKKDLLEFIEGANNTVYKNNLVFLQNLNQKEDYSILLKKVASHDDKQLIRLLYEYLPLTFSRRHGDPSRPWNRFAIEIKKGDGSKNLNFQGNWRDIFQNWEALGLSYPSFIEGMISKFLNASTADGYNPYRITRDGIDWESPDPHDPWANIGYWGDHQIIYLQKFLEISKKYHPGVLNSMLTESIFAYANVPYRIKSYEDLVKNPFDTIEFDFEAEKIALERVENIGSDGKLILESNGNVLQVNFTEKLLAMLLAKLSNFIPEAGIWLNTQRPEWNDANNALVGNGVSMVTLYHIRRLQSFCLELFKGTSIEKIEVSEEMAVFFDSIFKIFEQYKDLLITDISDSNRRLIADGLGYAGSNYREKIYRKGFSGNKETINVSELVAFFELTIKHFDHSIRKNKREDNLYHSYNLISFKEKSISIRHLYEMLEGQVAILSASVLNTEEVNQVLDALKGSAMFRKDQFSYMLYPDRQLPRFTEKNNIPSDLVQNSKLLSQLISESNSDIIYKDIDGVYHFNSSFRNGADLKSALNLLPAQNNLEQEKESVLQIFEKVFDHQSFTGRSGTFYGFEGLGCIYWHMVSKLLLAISENYFLALQNTTDEIQLGRLVKHYYDVRAGIGFNKSPELFGAFPTDAYSHTPGNGGAKQPGMTGQVKEDIISRFGELGINVQDGKIVFNPGLLRKSEFLMTADNFEYFSIQNHKESINLKENNLVFTFCQVPFVYHISEKNRITVTNTDGSLSKLEGLTIDEHSSKEIFERTNSIKQVDVYLVPRLA
ncbi:hypothetical protein [Flavobacterium soyangense]|uniref:Cellobiose phosphorylase n=1 Tax=Flavobacterium soyangense TaxID=2023265 RepID=A0A930XYP1_9FLAO|nr:hypothetical protein [Flavobacterium soyangense]MBF2708033.1 hypothetical protein [Flavobacterium soyangense]